MKHLSQVSTSEVKKKEEGGVLCVQRKICADTKKLSRQINIFPSSNIGDCVVRKIEHRCAWMGYDRNSFRGKLAACALWIPSIDSMRGLNKAEKRFWAYGPTTNPSFLSFSSLSFFDRFPEVLAFRNSSFIREMAHSTIFFSFPSSGNSGKV